jgi:hypothetical protein
MPEITFIFGPNNTFFFDCPKSWKFHGIPQTLRQLLNSSMTPAWRIAQPYCLALGPQVNSSEPIWYCGCKVLEGQEKILYSQNTFDVSYPDLAAWTKTVPNAPRACFVTFGPGLSYFACAPGHGSIWAGAPSELTDKVQKAYDTPNCVSMGLNQAWFVMWSDGYYSWKFYGSYGGLDKILNESEPRSVSYLAISPYNAEHYFVAFKDRTVKYNFAGAPEWMPLMHEVFREWQVEILQRQNMPPLPPMPYQNQFYPQQPNLNQYNPTGQPAYIAAHYASSPPPVPVQPYMGYNSPPLLPASPHGNGMLSPPQPPPGRPMSIMSSKSSKKRSFFSRKKTLAAIPGNNASAVAVGASEGSQTCTVM